MTSKQVLDFINQSNGKIFSIKFKKRTTNEIREMVCRTGVKKYISQNVGKKAGLDFKANALIPVYDMQIKEYRSIPIENILEIKIDGEWVKVEERSDAPVDQKAQ